MSVMAQQAAACEASRSRIQFNNAVELGEAAFRERRTTRFWRDRVIAKHLGSAGPAVPVEIVWLKCFEMLSECFVQIAQRVENGSDLGP